MIQLILATFREKDSLARYPVPRSTSVKVSALSRSLCAGHLEQSLP